MSLELIYTLAVSFDPPPGEDAFDLHGDELDDALSDAVQDWAMLHGGTAYIREIAARLA